MANLSIYKSWDEESLNHSILNKNQKAYLLTLVREGYWLPRKTFHYNSHPHTNRRYWVVQKLLGIAINKYLESTSNMPSFVAPYSSPILSTGTPCDRNNVMRKFRTWLQRLKLSMLVEKKLGQKIGDNKYNQTFKIMPRHYKSHLFDSGLNNQGIIYWPFMSRVPAAKARPKN